MPNSHNDGNLLQHCQSLLAVVSEIRFPANRGGSVQREWIGIWKNMLTLCIFLVVFPGVVMAGEIQPLGVFSSGSLDGWESKSFEGTTSYVPVTLDGVVMLRAESNGTASGMALKKEIDLTKTPFLNWSWRVDHVLSPREETLKSGDDYPARIYVVVSGGFAFWKTRALNYVWASSMPANATWLNAFTSRAQMLALRSGSVDTGRVVFEKRNVREDLKQYLDLDAEKIDAVALMTDTDNGGGRAVAYYGDIYFSAE